MLHCPRNIMIDVMQLELNLSSILHSKTEANSIVALRHMRLGAANKLVSVGQDDIMEIRIL